jgi:Raf kinase inhibitor-like YbhB/YbcL family protein
MTAKHRYRRFLRLAASALLLASLSCGIPPSSFVSDQLDEIRAGQPAPVLTVTSPHLRDGGPLPSEFICRELGGADVSPPLFWKFAPANVKAWAVTLTENDGPSKQTVFWGLINVPGGDRTMPKKITGHHIQPHAWMVYNSVGENKYNGPCPADQNPHAYTLRLYALDPAIPEPPGQPTLDDIQAILTAATIQSAAITVYYPPLPAGT